MAKPSAAKTPRRASYGASERRSEGWLDQVRFLAEAGHFEGAALLLDDHLERHPRSVDRLYWRTMIELASGRDPTQGLIWAERLIHAAPGAAQHHWLLGRARKALGQTADAIDCYRRALVIKPDFTDAWVSLGIAYRSAGQLDEAVSSYRRALRLRPEDALAHANLGNALAERELALNALTPEAPGTEGIAAQRRAVALDPDNAQLKANLATNLEGINELEEAADCFNHALGLDPERQDWLCRMGGCLIKLRKPLQAVAVYEKWMDTHPESGLVASNIAYALLEASDPFRAAEWADKAVELQPDFGGGYLARGSVRLRTGEAAEAIADFRRSIELSPGIRASALSGVLMASNYVEENANVLLEEHRQFNTVYAEPAGPLNGTRSRAGRALRVGFVSADFKQHSVAWFFETLMQNYDRAAFEFLCYHNTFTFDAATERIRSCATEWVDCFSLSDLALHHRIRQDHIDVLVDLSGHTQGHRLAVFAGRSAPVQMTYLGYPTTTGLAQIDFRISDAVIDPPDGPQMNVEQALLCSESMFCYRADVAPAVARAPCEHNGWVTFGSFNNVNKLSDRTLRLWAAVLGEVPDSQLFVKSAALALDAARATLRERMARAGIDPARVRFDPWRPDKLSHLETYREVDIGLDTFPYNGATTTCEALWMGVPVVTLCGATHVSRMGASILSAARRAQWITRSPEEFVACAKRLAGDRAELARVRTWARRDLPLTPLMDAPRFARDFERVLLDAWDRRGEPCDAAAA